MAKYSTWTVKVMNIAEVQLFIDNSPAADFFKENVKESVQAKLIPDSNRITVIRPSTDDESLIEVAFGGKRLFLKKEKFKKTHLFNHPVENTDSLLRFWETCGEFLDESPPEDKRKSSLLLFESQDSVDQSFEEKNLQRFDLNEASNTNSDTDPEYEKDGAQEVSSSKRSCLLDSISHKNVTYKILDIFDLKDPPSRYRVREVDYDFVEQLCNVMIEKSSISVDNAPSVIGMIDINKEDFKEEQMRNYKIYVIDGNHSIHAQRQAYKKTLNPIFKYRTVNIYCGLTEEEALFLGVTRNEDTGSYRKFSDFQKVDLLRKRLYQMTNTPCNEDPPSVPESFKEIFTSFLNLKGKKEIDCKHIIRFLATSLSLRCFDIYKDICKRKSTALPASKFDCLRGLTEEAMFEQLQVLVDSELKREDWQQFTLMCQEKQKRKKKQRKDKTATVRFNEDYTARLFIDNKAMVGNIVCFKFTKDEGRTERILTHEELKKTIFAKKSGPDIHDYSDILPVFTSSPDTNDQKKADNDLNASPSSDENEESSFSSNIAQSSNKTNSSKTGIFFTSDRRNRDLKKLLPNTIMTLSPSKLNPNVYKRHFIHLEGSKELHQINKNKRPIYSFSSTESQSPEKLQEVQKESQEPRMVENPIIVVPTCSNSSSFFANKARISTSANGLDASISEFLYIVANESAARNAESGRSIIEEDEVETKPECLTEHVETLLNPQIQKGAKRFFTSDAWLTLSNTFDVMQDRFVVNVQRTYDFESYTKHGKGKGKGLCRAKETGKKRKNADKQRKTLKLRITDISSVKDIPKYMSTRLGKKSK